MTVVLLPDYRVLRKVEKPRPNQLIGVIQPQTAERSIIASLAGYAAAIKHNPACKATAKMGAAGDFERARAMLRGMGKPVQLTPWHAQARRLLVACPISLTILSRKSNISMLFSPYRTRLPPSPIRIKKCCTTFSSPLPQKPCVPLRLIPNISGQKLASSPCSTVGARTSCFIPTSIVSCQAAASLLTASAGLHAGLVSSSPYACCPVGSAACLCNPWKRRLRRAS